MYFISVSGKETIMIKAGIIGATGYAGAEIVRILLGHKDVEIVWYGSKAMLTRDIQMFWKYDEAC